MNKNIILNPSFVVPVSEDEKHCGDNCRYISEWVEDILKRDKSTWICLLFDIKIFPDGKELLRCKECINAAAK